MSKGFIYVVATLTRDYVQKAFCNVPTQWKNRLYFGPCKIPMRPKMWPGHWVFGISPSTAGRRRIVFVAKLEERIPFADAYNRFPDLRGPEGPIHVRPVDGVGSFPESSYQHIPEAMHEDDWPADLAREELDAFFVCSKSKPYDWRGRWLGKYGPEVDNEILRFLKKCTVHGKTVGGAQNSDATIEKPIRHGNLYTGLHLETDQAETLIELCNFRMKGKTVLLEGVLTPTPRPGVAGECGTRKDRPKSSILKPIRAIKRKC